MAGEDELAAEYRKHASALSAAAEFDQDADTSKILRRIAREYDLMVKALERKFEKKLSPSQV